MLLDPMLSDAIFFSCGSAAVVEFIVPMLTTLTLRHPTNIPAVTSRFNASLPNGCYHDQRNNFATFYVGRNSLSKLREKKKLGRKILEAASLTEETYFFPCTRAGYNSELFHCLHAVRDSLLVTYLHTGPRMPTTTVGSPERRQRFLYVENYVVVWTADKKIEDFCDFAIPS